MNPSAALPLRDIHLPADPSWWPPAPGWWLLAGLLLVALWLLGGRVRRAWQKRRARRLLLDELRHIRSRHPLDDAPVAALAAASELLRRACRRHAPQALPLKDEAWLQFLDQGLPDRPFTTGAGRRLLDGPYRPQLDPADARAALDAVARRLPLLVHRR